MIKTFGNKLAHDLVENTESKETRRFPRELIRLARRKLQIVHEAAELRDLKAPPGNRLEQLRGTQTGYYAIRVNDQWRLIFKFDGHDAYEVKIIDYH